MTPSRRLLAAVTAVVMLAATPAVAEWTVARVSQPARYALDGRSWQPLTVGTEVPNRAWIHTGGTGRLLLRQDGDLVQFKPNTVAALSRHVEAGVETRTILEKFGSILVDVQPHPSRSSVVETPYLAVIVQGTQFEVEVGLTSVEMRVHEGVVRATHLTLGRRADVHAGQVALAQGHRRFVVRGRGPEPRIVPVEPREPRVNPARPARPPVQMSAPHSDSDGRGEAARRPERREREAPERLAEAEPAQEKDKSRRRDRKEKRPDRPTKEDDAPNGDGPGSGEAPDEDAPPDHVNGEPDIGHTDLDEEPGDDTPDEEPGSDDPDIDEELGSEDSDIDEALAPVWYLTASPHQG